LPKIAKIENEFRAAMGCGNSTPADTSAKAVPAAAPAPGAPAAPAVSAAPTNSVGGEDPASNLKPESVAGDLPVSTTSGVAVDPIVAEIRSTLTLKIEERARELEARKEEEQALKDADAMRERIKVERTKA